jgi:hypothetical protein
MAPLIDLILAKASDALDTLLILFEVSDPATLPLGDSCREDSPS